VIKEAHPSPVLIFSPNLIDPPLPEISLFLCIRPIPADFHPSPLSVLITTLNTPHVSVKFC